MECSHGYPVVKLQYMHYADRQAGFAFNFRRDSGNTAARKHSIPDFHLRQRVCRALPAHPGRTAHATRVISARDLAGQFFQQLHPQGGCS